ncbi:hypothetical protein I4U23_023298 [Adineta vaga]|nr:hypothetical protein I4U23_023298 [Adineta vaga]
MAVYQCLGSVCKKIYEQLLIWNVFDSRSSDPSVIRRELLSTRVYLILLIISITILTTYTSFTLRNNNESVTYPTYSVYYDLYKKYFDSLQCSCTTLSIPYGKFVRTVASFHQVCSSEFVSQRWIDFLFTADLLSIWPVDVRTSLSAMWQMVRSFCQNAYQTIIDMLNEFNTTSLNSAILLNEKLLEAKVQSILSSLREIASTNLVQSITIVDRMAQANQLITALGTNYIAFKQRIFVYRNI